MAQVLLGKIVVLVALEVLNRGLHNRRVVIEGTGADLLDIED